MRFSFPMRISLKKMKEVIDSGFFDNHPMSPTRKKRTTKEKRMIMVIEFVNLNYSSWYENKKNDFFGKQTFHLNYLTYWAQKGKFGPDYNEHTLIHLEKKFREYYKDFKL
jgi:hypothetical protein